MSETVEYSEIENGYSLTTEKKGDVIEITDPLPIDVEHRSFEDWMAVMHSKDAMERKTVNATLKELGYAATNYIQMSKEERAQMLHLHGLIREAAAEEAPEPEKTVTKTTKPATGKGKGKGKTTKTASPADEPAAVPNETLDNLAEDVLALREEVSVLNGVVRETHALLQVALMSLGALDDATDIIEAESLAENRYLPTGN